jgi:methyl-accepting chemotaxis protein
MFKRLKFVHKIVILPCISIAALLTILLLLQISSNQNQRLMSDIARGNEVSRSMQSSLLSVQRGFQDAASASDSAMLNEVDAARASYLNMLNSAANSSALDRDQVEKIRKEFETYCSLARETTERMIRQETGEEVSAGINEMMATYNTLKADVDRAVSQAEHNIQANFQKARSSQTFAVNLTSGILAVTAFLLIAITVLTIRSVLKPLKKALAASLDLAEGRLCEDISSTTNDEIGTLVSAMRKIVDYLRDVSSVANAVAIGDFSKDVRLASDGDVLGKSMLAMKQKVQALVEDTYSLARTAARGDLSVRVDTRKHSGEYAKIIEAINGTLDAIINPINESSAVLERVAERDLTVRIQGNYEGDFARIKHVLNKAVQNLDDALERVASGSAQVTAATGQISSGSQSLSQSSSKAASAFENISSSLQDVSSIIRQNTANAKEAQTLSEITRSSTLRGVESMSRLSDAINRIKESSDSTARIIKTIDEIAFQTNLLALNAAVEAARAGDAGKGFAVVAEEVRNLAIRSAEAAKNTAKLIEESVVKSESGVRINQEVLKNLEEIDQQINKLMIVMTQIADASDNQSRSIEHVNVAVQQMNEITQGTAAHAEESASAAEELASQSTEMSSMVQGFKLSGTTFSVPDSAFENGRVSPAAIDRRQISQNSAALR